MAWNKGNRKRGDSGEWTGFVEQGVKIEGKVESSGTFRIDSAMKGVLVSSDTLIVGEHATIEGEIHGNRVVLQGRFDGMIEATGRVEIQPNAIVTGEIHTPCLLIEPGGVFDGQCHMLARQTEQAPGGKAKPITIPIRSTAQSRG